MHLKSQIKILNVDTFTNRYTGHGKKYKYVEVTMQGYA